MRLPLLLSILFIIPVYMLSQRNCATMEVHEQMLINDPHYEKNLQKIQQHTRDIIAQSSSKRNNGVITIPVVVHVVYNTEVQNISDAQILSQIMVLTQDFRRLNGDAVNTPSDFLPVAADVEIEFCLATIDPMGNLTNGITRTFTDEVAFTTDNAVKFTAAKGKDAWPSGDYLNIWVCNLSGNTLGYAQFPGGSEATDGVVIDYLYFGTLGTATSPFNLGRTATHEVGHWLNLRHIWGDGNCNFDDGVSDTPLARDANYTGFPCTYPGPNSCREMPDDLPDMFQNYMDYSDDGCMNLFTLGQKERMLALFENGGFRESLLTSQRCGPPADPTCDDGFQNGDETGIDCGGSTCPVCPTCDDGIQNGNEEGVDCGGSFCQDCPFVCNANTVIVRLTFDDYPSETSWEFRDEMNVVVASGGNYRDNLAGSTMEFLVCLTSGCYEFIIYDIFGDGMCCRFGSGSYSVIYEGDIVASGDRFNSSEISPICVEDTYIFEGIINTDWHNASNWNKNKVPPEGYNGHIIIANHCVVTGIDPFAVNGQLTILSGSTLTCQ